MKTLSVLAIFTILSLASCKTKEVDCSTSAVKSPCYIAFKGFPDSSLHTVVRSTYKQGTNFTQLIQKDTFIYPKISFNFDTAFSSSQHGLMGVMSAGNDYVITLPSAARTFRITAPTYTWDTVSHWTGERNCDNIHSFSVEPLSLTVDNQFYYTVPLAYNNSTRWIVLR